MISPRFCLGILTITISLSASFVSAAEIVNRVGKIYPLKGATEQPIFVQKIRLEQVDSKTRKSISTIENPEGEIVMKESAVMVDGVVVEQTMEQLQIQERYELRTVDGKVQYKTFNTADSNKLTSDKSEKLKKDFLTGPATDLFLKSKSADLLKGKTVTGNFGVFEVGRSVEFDFIPAKKQTPETGLKLKMKPASFFISVFVDAMDVELEPETYRLKRFQGRTPVRLKVGNSWKPLDAIIHYSTLDSK